MLTSSALPFNFGSVLLFFVAVGRQTCIVNHNINIAKSISLHHSSRRALQVTAVVEPFVTEDVSQRNDTNLADV